MSSGEESPTESGSLELAILGSGSAFSEVGHNAGYLVDQDLLLECGAPATALLGQAGRSLAQLRQVLISHLHGDHFSQLPLLLAARAVRHEDAPPLRVAGPRGTEAQLHALGKLDLGDDFWAHVWASGQVSVEEWSGGQSGSLGDYRIQAYQVEHAAQLICLGFRIEKSGVRLGYSGDTTLCQGVRDLAGSVDYLLCECSSMTAPAPIHMWREEVEQLMAECPQARFILTHLSERAQVKGAILASDGLVLRLQAVPRD
ncbi:MAG: MBL fold metallo-hydrolase [Candidatus Dormibacteria bacterium]